MKDIEIPGWVDMDYHEGSANGTLNLKREFKNEDIVIVDMEPLFKDSHYWFYVMKYLKNRYEGTKLVSDTILGDNENCDEIPFIGFSTGSFKGDKHELCAYKIKGVDDDYCFDLAVNNEPFGAAKLVSGWVGVMPKNNLAVSELLKDIPESDYITIKDFTGVVVVTRSVWDFDRYDEADITEMFMLDNKWNCYQFFGRSDKIDGCYL